MTKQVLHRQVYRRGPFGGTVNTTFCGRVRNQQDYNVAEIGEAVTCKFCIQNIARFGEPQQEVA